MRSARIVFIFVLSCACVAAQDAGIAAQYPELHNLMKLDSRIYSGGEPKSEAAFAELEKLGVKCIVSVDGAAPDIEAAKRYGLRYVHIPIGYDGVPKEAGESLYRLVKEVEGPFYIHCHHGKHRGPAAAAVACRAAGLVDAQGAEAILRRAGTSEGYAGLWRDVAGYVPPAPGAVLPALVERAEVTSLAAAMAKIDRSYDNLTLIKEAGWNTPAEHPDLVASQEALILLEAFRESARLAGAEMDPELKRGLVEAEAEAAELEGALRAGDAAGVSRVFEAVAASCKGCHAEFRN